MANTNTKEKFGWLDLIRGYFFLLGDKKKIYLFWNICLILLLSYSVVPPLLLGKIVDFFGTYKTGDSLNPFYLLIVVLGVSFAIVSFFRLTLKNTLSNLRIGIAYVLKLSGFENLLDFSIEWHDQQMVGEKSQRISYGISALNDLSQMMENIVFEGIAGFIGIIVVFLFLKPYFILFFLLYLLMFFTNLVYFNTRIQKKIREQSIAQEKSSGAFIEGLNNLLTIKTMGANKHFSSHIARKEEHIRNSGIQVEKLIFTLWKNFQILNGLSYTFFLFLIGQAIVSGDISAGTLVIFYGYLQTMIGTTARLNDLYDRASRDKSAISRMLPIYQTSSKVKSGNLKFPKHWQEITIQKGNFTYRSAKDSSVEKALVGIDLVIPRFAKIGLVGRSGSGKSTIVKLLMGLYAFKSGEYRIGEHNFYDLQEQDVKKEMTLILQDSEMFNLSLMENITLLRPLNPELLELAVEIAQLGPVIEKLPEGLGTLIGEKGYHLSGGERQRVGIARAIYKNSQILIFDESTSSLDSKTETAVLKGLETRLEKKTVIFIAHKVSALKNVDRIIVMDNGKIVEEGTYQKLSHNPSSHFHKIYSTQLKQK